LTARLRIEKQHLGNNRHTIVKKGSPNAAGFCKTAHVHKQGRHKNNLYYLMPGMGRGARKRFWRNLFLGVLAGLVISAAMWWLFSYQNTR
jgi:hypothetical protein